MKKYGTEELGKLATTTPVNNNIADMDIVTLIKKAQASRNYHMNKWISDAVKGYKANRDRKAAKEALHGMSDRELLDNGRTRGEIDQAVEDNVRAAQVKTEGFWARIARRFIEAQQA